VQLYERLSRKELGCRPSSNLGLLGTYDGNILGGAMVGIGMALTGACPGTVLVQVGTGTTSGRYAIVGGVLGGIIYTILAKTLPKPQSLRKAESKPLSKTLGISSAAAIVLFETMCISLILEARHFAPGSAKSFLDPVSGGLFIGAAQLIKLILTSSPIGVSTFYEDIGRWVCSRFGSGESESKSSTKAVVPMSKAIAFAGGILASSLAISTAVPAAVAKDSLAISPLRGVLGGLIMVFGARIAGGCPSGHGISGMSMLGLSSFITVASMFAGGIGLALIL
jgi:uncharacterized membrane protein YedE/YeeE